MPLIPNEVLLQICKSLNPCDSDDAQTLLALRKTCSAGRDFATPYCFKVFSLRGGIEQSRRQAFGIFNPEAILDHIKVLDLNIRGMIPQYYLHGAEEPPGETKKDKAYYDSTAYGSRHEFDLRDRAVRYARDFTVLLDMVFRACKDRATNFRIDTTCDGIFSDNKFPEVQEEWWIETFWQAYRLALQRVEVQSSLKKAEIYVESLAQSDYFWLQPRYPEIDFSICLDDNKEYEEVVGDEHNVVKVFSSIKIIVADSFVGRKSKYPIKDKTDQKTVKKKNEAVTLFCRKFLNAITNLQNWEMDFGSANCFYMATDISHFVDDNIRWPPQLTSIKLHWYVERDDGDNLAKLLIHNKSSVKTLHLTYCAIAWGSHPYKNWEHFFSKCKELTALEDVFFEGLDYFQTGTCKRLMKGHEKFERIGNWNYGLPLHSPFKHDYKKFEDLVNKVRLVRDEINYPRDKWLYDFLDNEPTCWEIKDSEEFYMY